MLFAPAEAVNVTIVTKPFAPFVTQAGDTGYSIDYAKEMLTRTFGSINLTTQIVVVENNQQIFDMVRNYPVSNRQFAIGTAGITITAERDELGDFLPQFFTSGFQILVKDKSSTNVYVTTVITRLMIALGVFLLVLVVLVYTLAAFIWAVEFKYCPEGQVPLFIDPAFRKERYTIHFGDTCTCSRRTLLMGKEIFNACKWTFRTLSGTRTAYPSSSQARSIHSGLKKLSSGFFLLALTTCTAIAALSGSNLTIKSYGDLPGNTVCTVVGSTSEFYLDRENNGFRISRRLSVDAMFVAFWDDKCDAVVYDFPILQQAVKDHGGGAIVVGKVFNVEHYGIFIREGNPYEEELGRTVNRMNLDATFIDGLTNKWFDPVDTTPSSKFVLPIAIYIVFSLFGFVVFIIVFWYMQGHYAEHEDRHTKLFNDCRDNDYSDDRERLKAELQSTDSNYEDTDLIIRNLAGHVVMTQWMLTQNQRPMQEIV